MLGAMAPGASPDPIDAGWLARRLLYGAPETRSRIAQELRQTHDPTLLDLLASTVRSSEPWQLRARCLEVLGLAAGGGEQVLAEHILAAVAGNGLAVAARPSDGGRQLGGSA